MVPVALFGVPVRVAAGEKLLRLMNSSGTSANGAVQPSDSPPSPSPAIPRHLASTTVVYVACSRPVYSCFVCSVCYVENDGLVEVLQGRLSWCLRDNNMPPSPFITYDEQTRNFAIDEVFPARRCTCECRAVTVVVLCCRARSEFCRASKASLQSLRSRGPTGARVRALVAALN